MSGKVGIAENQPRELENQELKLEKEKFESIAEASPFGMLLISDDLTLEYVNPKFIEMFGYERSEIPTAHHWREKAYPDPDYRNEVVTAWKTDLARARAGEGPRDRIFNVRCKDGTEKVVHFRPVQLSSGSNLMTCEDITSFKNIQEKMNSTLSILESTLESTADGILVMGIDRGVRVCNEKFLEIWGIKDREILQKGGDGLLDYARELLADPQPFLERAMYLREHPEEESFETLVFKNGRVVERHSVPQKIAGRTVGRVYSFRDVTEKMAAEQAIIRAKEEWELTFDSVQDFMAIFDTDFRVLRLNAAMEKINGVREEDAIGRFCYEVTKCAEGSLENCPLHAIVDNQSHVLIEHHDYVKNMSLESRMSPIVDSGGTLRGYVHVTRDITDRKELEKELADAIEDLKRTNIETKSMLDSATTLLENTDFMESAKLILESARLLLGTETSFLNILNDDGTEQRLLCLNPGCSNCMLKPSTGVTLAGIELMAHEEWRTVYKNDPNSDIRVALMPEGCGNLENIMISPLVVRNRTIGFLGLANKPGGFSQRDVFLAESFAEFASLGLMNGQTSEELQRSEERYRMIFASSPMGIMHYNREGVILDCNEPFVEIMGSCREKLIGMRMLERLNNEEVIGAVRISLTGQTGYFEGDYLSVTGNRLAPVKAVFNPVKSEDGRFIGAVCIIEDVSGLKAAEEALVQAERVKAVADLASGVAHNFNNLLQIITGSMELAILDLEKGRPDEARRSIEKIRDSARIGAETVRRLQTFARVRVDERRNDAKDFDISETISQAIKITTPLISSDPLGSKPQIRVSQKLEHGVMIHGRDDEIFEVIVNLIKNAAEACPKGGDISLNLYSEADQAVIEISDNGKGIAQEDIKKVFDPFWTSLKTNIGTGLGLPLSHGIVTNHGGSITVSSVEGRGTTFVIRLPLAEEQSVQEKMAEQPVMGLPMTVLTIDDMETIVEMLGEVMTQMGHRAFTATSGDEAMEIYRNNRIDVVVCDLVMPRMDGWQVGKAIKSICADRGIPKTPFVLLTGWGGQALEEDKIRESSVDALLEKPIDIKKLVDVMGRLVTTPLV